VPIIGSQFPTRFPTQTQPQIPITKKAGTSPTSTPPPSGDGPPHGRPRKKRRDAPRTEDRSASPIESPGPTGLGDHAALSSGQDSAGVSEAWWDVQTAARAFGLSFGPRLHRQPLAAVRQWRPLRRPAGGKRGNTLDPRPAHIRCPPEEIAPNVGTGQVSVRFRNGSGQSSPPRAAVSADPRERPHLGDGAWIAQRVRLSRLQTHSHLNP
jgi:hypothetical protein